MKLETTARILKSALIVVGRAADSKSVIPILGMVRFADGSVTATDLDNEISVKLPASRFEGAACLPLRSLLRLVSNLSPDDNVRIFAGASGATVSFSSGRYDLPTCEVSDFPELVFAEPAPLALDGERLKKAVTFVSPFISTEETRYYLNGVHISSDAAVATDGHRLGWHPLGFDGGAFDQAILPRRLVDTLMISPAPKSAQITKGKIAFEMDGMSVRAKLIDGTYPDYRRVVPTMSENAARLTLDRAAFLKMIARIVALGAGSGVTLAWDDAHLAAAAKFGFDEGTARETLAVLGPSTSGISTYNARYLAGMMRRLRSEVVTMFCEDGRGPSVWRGDDDSFVVLMPMRDADHGGIAANLLTSLQAGTPFGEAA